MWWSQYKKTFVVSQLFIVTICLVSYFVMKLQPPVIFTIFIAMQLGSVAGAFFGARLRRQLDEQDKRLPLDP